MKRSDIRYNIIYDKKQLKKISLYKQKFNIELKLLEIEDEKNIIHENQITIGKDITAKFFNKRIIIQMVIGKTQSGKTGAMLSTIKAYLNDPDNNIPIENIFIITGLSNVDWKVQTINRLPESFDENIFHRDNLNKFIKKIEGKSNILILMDEIQIAAKENQSVFRTFKSLGFYNIEYLSKNDIKIVEFTATPDGLVYDLEEWAKHSYRHQIEPGIGYQSLTDYFLDGRVKQFKKIYGNEKDNDKDEVIENMKELQDDIDKYFEKPMYHIIRTNKGDNQSLTICWFKEVFGERYNYTTYDQSNDSDINTILNKEPIRHTFIFVKELLRCAITLEKTYLGVLYERWVKNMNDSVIIQGLGGRMTGYDDNGQTICYTNIDTIKRYEQLWGCGFEKKDIIWKSATTGRKNGKLIGKNTFNSTKHIKGLKHESYDKEPHIEIFKSFDEASNYIRNTLHAKRGPIKPSYDINGFIHNNLRGKSFIMSTTYIENNKSWGLNDYYRLHYCYRNTSDKDTLEYWVITPNKIKFEVYIKLYELNELEKLKDSIIKSRCKKHKLPTGGKNLDLINRLCNLRLTLTIQPVKGDGHCFYQSVAYYTKHDVNELRNLVADYMLEHQEEFEAAYVADDYNGLTFEEYIQKVRKTNEWAGNIEIQALQRVIGRPIIIFENNRTRREGVTVESDGDPVYIMYNGVDHYDALIKK